MGAAYGATGSLSSAGGRSFIDFGGGFGAAQRAQDIAAGELGEIGVAPAAADQFGEEDGIGLDPFQPGRRVGNAVEIAADARHGRGRRPARHARYGRRPADVGRRARGLAASHAFTPGLDRGLAGAVDGLEPRFLGGATADPVPHVGRDEAGDEIDHHHAAIGGQQAEHVVGDVARMAVHAARRAVRKDHRRPAGGDRVAHRVGRNVAQVDQHAEPVHLARPPSARTATGRHIWLRRWRCRPIRWSGCGSASCSARRGGRIGAARRRLPPIWRPPSIPISEAILPGLVDPDDVVGGQRPFEIARVSGDHPVDDVDLLDASGGSPRRR